MQFLKKIISSLSRYQPKRIACAVPAVFLSFVIAHTFRLALFDNLLFDPGATISSCVQNSGMFIKFIIVCVVFIALAAWKRPFVFIAFYLVQTLYMFINITYHFYFEGYLHVNQYIGMFSEAFDLLKHKALPSGPQVWWFLFLDFPFFILCLILYRRISPLASWIVVKKPLIFVGAVCIGFVSFWDPLKRDGEVLTMMNDAYSSDSHVVKKYGLLAFTLADLFNYKDAKTRIQRFNYGRELSLTVTDSTHPNFIVIQLESIDSYIVNYRHNGVLVTPFLHALSKQCVFYPFTLSFHKAGSTSDCEFSIISSIEPFDDYPSIKLRNYDYPNSMLKPLVIAGYDAVAFHGNRGSYFNRNIALKKMGFSSFYDMMAMRLEEKAWGASDGDVFDFITNKLKTQKSPFFYYIITMSSHEPFNLMKSYFSTNAYDDIKDELQKRFLTAMSYLDEELGKFVGYLRETTANTYIIIYGDHTPTIPKTSYKKASYVTDLMLFEFVPCYIITPHGAISRENHQVASFLDIAPTILRASKVPCSYKSNGVDLLSRIGDSATISFNRNVFFRSKLFFQIQANQR